MGAILHSDRFFRPAIRRIGSEDEAFEAADALSRRLVAEGGQSCRIAIARSGLLALSIPDEFGGADLTNAALADVVRRLAIDAPQAAWRLAAHFVASEIIRNASGPVQLLFAQVIDGAMLDATFEDAEGAPLADAALDPARCGLDPALWTVVLRKAASGAASVRLKRATQDAAPAQTEDGEWLEGAVLRIDESALPMVSAVSTLLCAGIFLGELEQADRALATPDLGPLAPSVIARETVAALADRLGNAIDRAQISPGAASIVEVARLAAVLAHMHATFAATAR